MPSRICRVSFTDSERITHAAEVSASTLYEACVLALAEFRRCGMTDVLPGPATDLTVEVRNGSTAHTTNLSRVRTWLAGGAKSPSELIEKKRLNEILESK